MEYYSYFVKLILQRNKHYQGISQLKILYTKSKLKLVISTKSTYSSQHINIPLNKNKRQNVIFKKHQEVL